MARLIAVLLGALGIWGISVLVHDQLGAGVAWGTAIILAIHPAYLDQIIYDKSANALWMGILGLVALCLSRYLKRPSAGTAFWFGFTIGLGIWGRLNFLWLVGSAVLAASIVIRKKILFPRANLVSSMLGAAVGMAPLVAYEFSSHAATYAYIHTREAQSLAALVPARLNLLFEVLLSDSEHRWIWNGPPLPTWEFYLFPLLLCSALLFCLFWKEEEDLKRVAWRRITALTFLLFSAIMVFSKLPVTSHHLFGLLPIGAVVMALAAGSLIHQWRLAKIPIVLLALLYLGVALQWNVLAAREIRRTGGTSEWSNAIVSVSDYFRVNYPGCEVKILDWGFGNNLSFLSNETIRQSEIFWGATTDKTGLGSPWKDEVLKGGLYLTHPDPTVNFPSGTKGFLTALRESGRPFRQWEFHEQTGTPFADLYIVPPLGSCETGIHTQPHEVESVPVGKESPAPLPNSKPSAASKSERR